MNTFFGLKTPWNQRRCCDVLM